MTEWQANIPARSGKKGIRLLDSAHRITSPARRVSCEECARLAFAPNEFPDPTPTAVLTSSVRHVPCPRRFATDVASVVAGSIVHAVEPRPFLGHENAITSATCSRNGELLATGSVDSTVRVWELATGKQLARLDVGARVSHVEFVDEAKLIVVSDDLATKVYYQVGSKKRERGAASRIQLWHWQTNEAISITVPPPSLSVTQCIVSSTGKSIVLRGFVDGSLGSAELACMTGVSGEIIRRRGFQADTHGWTFREGDIAAIASPPMCAFVQEGDSGDSLVNVESNRREDRLVFTSFGTGKTIFEAGTGGRVAELKVSPGFVAATTVDPASQQSVVRVWSGRGTPTVIAATPVAKVNK